MKKILFFLCLLGTSYIANAQVGIGTPDPISAAMLQVDAKDKGILVPRVELTSLTTFAPVVGTETEANGLLVYNNAGTLSKGFYFWNDKKWNQIIDLANLEQNITNVITGDLGELKNIADLLVPTNPKSGDKTLSQAALVIDPKDNKIYQVSYDAAAKKYIRSDIKFSELIAGLETKTLIKRAEITLDKQKPNFTATTTAPDTLKTKKGEIYYQYLGENNQVDYLNLSSDVSTILENNEIIKNQITNILNQGGNVYYTATAVDGIPANSLYHIDLVSQKKVIIDISSNVLNSITENITEIKKQLGDQITNNTIINTGNQFDGEDVLVYKTTTTSTKGKFAEIDFTGKLPAGKTKLDYILSIKLFKDKKFVSNTASFITLDATNLKLKFEIGIGTAAIFKVADATYDIVIEFTAK